MLVLSRKEGQRILIDNGRIVITVVKISGGRVRIGVEAPQEVPVKRPEAKSGPKSTEAPAPIAEEKGGKHAA